MNRLRLISLFSLVVLFTFACAHNKETVETTEPVVQQEEKGDLPLDSSAAFAQVYDAYRAKLLLDNVQSYRVVRGDTLSKIAIQFYGKENGFYFPLVMLASSAVVLDPDLIEPGMELSIPDLQRNLNDPQARETIKLFLLDIAAVYAHKAETDSSNKTSQYETTRTHLIALSDSL